MAESGDDVLAAHQCEQQIPVPVAEEIEALVGARAVALGSADLVEGLGPDGGILQRADEFQVSMIGGGDNCRKSPKL